MGLTDTVGYTPFFLFLSSAWEQKITGDETELSSTLHGFLIQVSSVGDE